MKPTENQQQDQFNRAAYAACDSFRGDMDASQYKDYVLIVFFLRYLSGFWQDLRKKYAEEYAGDEERIARRLARARFVLPQVIVRDPAGAVTDSFPADFNNLFQRRERPNLGELIDATVTTIEDANKAKLERVFRGASFNSEAKLGRARERNERLKTLLEKLGRLDFNPPGADIDLAETFLYLIERFANDGGKKGGEFYTPRQISRLMVQLLEPKPGQRICDPACGSGGLLIEVARAIGGDNHGDSTDTDGDNKDNFALFGQDASPATWALARMNMFIHQHDAARLECGDTLHNPLLIENERLMQFDIVLANPPLSQSSWRSDTLDSDPYARYWRGMPPKSKSDYAFISHMIESAVPKTGRVAIILPHGALFHAAAEGRIRQRLIEDNLLDAVIGLPANLLPNTVNASAILIFDRAREPGGAREAERDVLFINASKGYVGGKHRAELSEQHLAKIVDTYRKRQPVEQYARLVSFEDIAAKNFNLNIPYYLDQQGIPQRLELPRLEQEIDELEQQLDQINGKIKLGLKQLAANLTTD